MLICQSIATFRPSLLWIHASREQWAGLPQHATLAVFRLEHWLSYRFAASLTPVIFRFHLRYCLKHRHIWFVLNFKESHRERFDFAEFVYMVTDY